MYWIGIDPGKSGGIAVLSDQFEIGFALAYKMPDTDRGLYELMQSIRDRIKEDPHDSDCFALIEKVHSMPGQGVKSVFTFGYHYGMERMGLMALRIPFEDITPATWTQPLIGQKRKKEKQSLWKGRIKGKVELLYPMVNNITLATSDALMIAHYNRHLHRTPK